MLCLLFFLFLFDQFNGNIALENPCVYNSSFGRIDLTRVGRKDGTPAWKNQVPDLSEKHGFLFILIQLKT